MEVVYAKGRGIRVYGIPCLFMITEVSICCQKKPGGWCTYTLSKKNPEVGVRGIPTYTPQYTTDYMSSVIRDSSYCSLWDVTIAVPLRCPVWCRLVTVPTDPFTTLKRPAGPFVSEWTTCQPGNTQNGGTVFLITNTMADSESGSPVSCSSFLVTIGLSHLVSEIFACDR